MRLFPIPIRPHEPSPLDLDLIGQWLRDFHLPAFFAVLISIAYFRACAPDQPLPRRALASAHGVTIAALYVGAWAVYLTHHASDAWARPYGHLMAVPVGFIVVSFILFRGKRMVHLLQVPNLFCLLWVWLRGTVVVTGLLF